MASPCLTSFHMTLPHFTPLSPTRPYLIVCYRSSPNQTEPNRTKPHRTGPHRTGPHRGAQRRTVPHSAAPNQAETEQHRNRAAPHRTAPHRVASRRDGPHCCLLLHLTEPCFMATRFYAALDCHFLSLAPSSVCCTCFQASGSSSNRKRLPRWWLRLLMLPT